MWHFWHADEDYGRRVAEGAGVDLEAAKRLPPLAGKPAPGKARSAATYTNGELEETASNGSAHTGNGHAAARSGTASVTTGT